MSQQFLYFSDIHTADLLIQSENAAIDLVTNSLTSDHSKCAYSKALTDFLAWMQASRKPFVKATIQEYRQTLTGSPASINLKMSAICKLATGAADNGLLDETIANGVSRVHSVTSHAVRAGNWLTKNRAQKILTAPNIETLKGLRDRTILAVMVGGGLRRSEVASPTFDDIKHALHEMGHLNRPSIAPRLC